MKNKRIYYILVIMIFIIVVMIINILKYNYLSIDKKIQDIKWYRYNYTNGLYESLYLKDGTIKYFKPTGTNNVNSLDNCTKYTFNKKNNTLKLNCNKKIKVVSYDKDYLSLDFDGKNEKFFTNIEDSLNYEFGVYYQKSITDYKKEKIQVTDISKINETKLYEVFKEDEYSKIIFIGNKCTSIDCVLVLDIMEKWISTNENIYYFDVNDLNDNIIKYMNKLGNTVFNYEYFDSAYPRIIDFKRIREISDKVEAYLMVDMAHIAGLVATGLHPSPIGYADVVTTTTHKTLRGPRGGLILTNDEEIAKKIDKTIFPGIQGGPLMHVIAAKAQCFYEALQPEFKIYMEQVVDNAKVLADTLRDNGFRIVSGGTDNHLLLVDVKSSIGMTGKEAETLLDTINITINKNTIPYDSEKPFITSGIRLGTPAMTTRGFGCEDFVKVGNIISECLKNKDDKKVLRRLKKEVLELTDKHPIYK